jgi:thymidylate synthase
MSWEHDYLKLLYEVAESGEVQEGRNGTTLSKFGVMIESRDLEDAHFPILTTRKMYPEGIFGELAAFVRGAEMLREFKQFGCNYWDANAAAWKINQGRPIDDHRVGKLYGSKWRWFHGVDQLEQLVRGLKEEPRSRRHVLTTYDPSEEYQCLPPCHLLAQYPVRR